MSKNKQITGYAIFKSGYWLICPSEYLAYVNNGFKHRGIRYVKAEEVNHRDAVGGEE